MLPIKYGHRGDPTRGRKRSGLDEAVIRREGTTRRSNVITIEFKRPKGGNKFNLSYPIPHVDDDYHPPLYLMFARRMELLAVLCYFLVELVSLASCSHGTRL